MAENTIYVKDDQNFMWEVMKAVIANLIQTIFLVLFSLLCWLARKFIMKMFGCMCKSQEEKNEEIKDRTIYRA
jgi:hypothetical protein